MAKAILLILVATPVCAALVVAIAVLSVHVLISGEPFSGGDVAMAFVFGLGSLAVVVLGLTITYRRRDRWAHKAIGVLLAVGTLVGVGGGAAFAASIIEDKQESMAAHVYEACATARRGGRSLPDCEERAVACIHEARRNPPPTRRELAPPPSPDDPERPVDATRRAVDDCLRR